MLMMLFADDDIDYDILDAVLMVIPMMMIIMMDIGSSGDDMVMIVVNDHGDDGDNGDHVSTDTNSECCHCYCYYFFS